MKVLIEFEKKPLLFDDPVDIIRCDNDDIESSFEQIENALAKGYHVAGFISYEAGHSLEDKLELNSKPDFPSLLFGVYKEPKTKRLSSGPNLRSQISNLNLNITEDQYAKNIAKIRHHISIGDVYQITYCIKHHFSFKGDPYTLYKDLYRVQPVPYAAYIESDDMRILSLSPERFIKKTGEDLLTEPMKGTWWRGGNIITDMIEKFRFSRDKKNKAENIMIADLLRNDMGRIASDIKWPKVYTITRYKTLFQMTSTVTGKVDRNIRISDIFKAMFPSGSVTGAPRIRAMQIIKEIEQEDRRIYTGAIGYITPQRDMYFNIPIRTILLSKGGTEGQMRAGQEGDGWRGEMGVGGGIVWDSTPEGEWNEGMIKSKFLTGLVKK